MIVVHQDRLTGQLVGVTAAAGHTSEAVPIPDEHAPKLAVLLRDADPGAAEPALLALRPFLLELEQVLEARKNSTAEKSYTRSLFEAGPARIGQKLAEEAGELARAVAEESQERVASEAADLVYHMLVGLRYRDVGLREVIGALAARFGTSGHVEKASRGG